MREGLGHTAMRYVIPALAGTTLVVLMTFMCSVGIQEDVLESASKAVSDGGHDWAGVEVDGRWVVVTGRAPNREELNAALVSAGLPDAVTRVFNGAGVRDSTEGETR
ncbi:MAG: hypothetical protein ACI80V_003747 [Rhodothermales bacterium]|jgi:hypothetical protein